MDTASAVPVLVLALTSAVLGVFVLFYFSFAVGLETEPFASSAPISVIGGIAAFFHGGLAGCILLFAGGLAAFALAKMIFDGQFRLGDGNAEDGEHLSVAWLPVFAAIPALSLLAAAISLQIAASAPII